MLELKGKTIVKKVAGELGFSLLDLALKNEIDWGFSCSRGTCARCRCLIVEGGELLSSPSDEELDRLEPDEIERGYRLACQARVKREGKIAAINEPYF